MHPYSFCRKLILSICIKPTVGAHITNSYIYITVLSIVLKFDHTCMHIKQSFANKVYIARLVFSVVQLSPNTGSQNIWYFVTFRTVHCYHKQEKKIIKNEKRCRDAMPKYYKQVRENIKGKVNIQSPIPASSSHYKVQPVV